MTKKAFSVVAALVRIHLAKQVVRSSSSCALNYAEAQSAESRADFAHKISIVLIELRETYVTLQLIESKVKSTNGEKMSALLKENDKLIAIFQSSVRTVLGKGTKNLDLGSRIEDLRSRNCSCKDHRS